MGGKWKAHSGSCSLEDLLTWIQTGDKTINLEKDDPYVFAHLLQYLYYGKYNVDPSINVKRDGIVNAELGGASVSKLISAGRRLYATENNTEEATIYPKIDMSAVHIEVYLLAEKYRIPELCQMSLELFGKQKIFTCKQLANAVNGNIGRANIELKTKIAYFVGEVFQEVVQSQDEAAKEVLQWLQDKYFCFGVIRSMSNTTHVLKKERDETCVEVQPPVKKARR